MKTISPQTTARSAACVFIGIFILGIMTELFIRPGMLVPGDAEATVKNIAASAALFRLSLVSDLLRQVKALGPSEDLVRFLDRYEVDTIVLSIGMLTNMEPFREWGLTLLGNGISVTPDMSTNLPGVYAAGDIVAYPGKVLLIAAGAGEAATAVNTAKEYIISGEMGR